MHIVSLGFPAKPTEEDKAGAIAFYNSLATTIPCPICKTHYRAFLAKSPVESAVASRHDLIHWVFDLHNNVNTQLGKRAISFDEYIAYMQALAASPRTTFPSASAPSFTTIALGTGVALGVAGALYYATTAGKK